MLVAREVQPGTSMVLAWVSALNVKAVLPCHDAHTVPSVNQSESDAGDVVEAAAKTAVAHFVAVLYFCCYPLVVVHRFLPALARSPSLLVQRMRAPVVERIRW